MTEMFWWGGVILAVVLGIEGGARLFYRALYGVPFHSRRIGEYPYRSFVERVDPPLHFRFKRGFRSPQVIINRFRCRGKEPAEDGKKKRVMVIGESNFFGAKLPRERDLWSYRLEDRLRENGFGDWEVLNAGNPTYNSTQHRLIWEQDLQEARPDVLLVNLGANDVTQAWMMGSQWTPGAPWPWEFIMVLERHSPWWNRLLSPTCLYFFVRRNLSARRPFKPRDDAFDFEGCLAHIRENLTAILEHARTLGAKVGVVSFAMANDREPKPEDRRKLSAIQANWEAYSRGNIHYMYKLLRFFRDKVCPDAGIPFIDLNALVQVHPRRYELFLDLAHWNARGMRVVADYLFSEAERLGWFKEGSGNEPRA